MNLQDTYTFDVGIEDVWNYIFAKGDFVSLIPRVEEISEIAPGKYEANIPIKVLLFKSDLSLKITIAELDKPHSGHFFGEAFGDLGEIRMEGTIWLKDIAGKTLLTYEADGDINGSLAKLAKHKIQATGKDKVRQRLQEIESRIKTMTASKASEQ